MIKEISANPMAFISCRNRLTKVLAGWGRPSEVTRLYQETVGIEVQVDMQFQIGGGYSRGWHQGVYDWWCFA
jgi:hypothetical protein